MTDNTESDYLCDNAESDFIRRQKNRRALNRRHPGVTADLIAKSNSEIAAKFYVTVDTIALWRSLTGIKQDVGAKLEARYPGVTADLMVESAANVARTYGVTRATVYNWRKALKAEQ